MVNYASVVRLQEVHNTLFEHHPYKVDFEPFLAGKHAMIDHLLLEEIYAVSVLCGPREGEGLTASAKGTHATCDFFSVRTLLLVALALVINILQTERTVQLQLHARSVSVS